MELEATGLGEDRLERLRPGLDRFEGRLLARLTPVGCIPIAEVLEPAALRTRDTPMRHLVERAREEVLAIEDPMGPAQGIRRRQIERLLAAAHEPRPVGLAKAGREEALEIPGVVRHRRNLP
jgi:hypothetical protein